MATEMGMSGQRGGHLYMQTNEIRNAVVHYRWSSSGTLGEAERVPTAHSIILTPDRQLLFTTLRAADKGQSLP